MVVDKLSGLSQKKDFFILNGYPATYGSTLSEVKNTDKNYNGHQSPRLSVKFTGVREFV